MGAATIPTAAIPTTAFPTIDISTALNMQSRVKGGVNFLG